MTWWRHTRVWMWGQRIQRRFWAYMPDPMLRHHILNAEMRWSGKGLAEEDLAEFMANAREWRF